VSGANAALSLRRFGVAFGPQVVLANVSLDLPSVGPLVLVGPSSSGKSTLLRTLAGLNDPQPALRTWGEAWVSGVPLERAERPAIVVQHARLLVSSVFENLVSALPDRARLTRVEQRARVQAMLAALDQDDLVERLDTSVLQLPLGVQRRVALARAAFSDRAAVLADEPTAGLRAEDVPAVIALARRIAETRALVMTTHHQGHARELGGTLALLAGGRVVEVAPTASFLDRPQTEAGRAWLAFGHCPTLASPSARPEELAEGVERPTPLPPRAREVVDAAREPRGFFWMFEGLGGMPRPGVVSELQEDLAGLRTLGITELVTLEESRTVDPATLATYGIRSEHVPIPDMEAPSLELAETLCRRFDERLARGERIAVHCLAGLGRTGTVLAAYAVWRGATALDAIDRARSLRPRAVQSDAQVEFLQAWEARLREARVERGA
jgi:atypical dual specificity phosphatase